MTPAMLALLVASPTPTSAAPPTPSPVVVWVKAERGREIVRIAFLGFDVDHPPRAPMTMVGTLSYLGRSRAVTMHRTWRGLGAVAGGWIPADYVMDIPRGATGEAVLSLSADKQGWSFRLGQM